MHATRRRLCAAFLLVAALGMTACGDVDLDPPAEARESRARSAPLSASAGQWLADAVTETGDVRHAIDWAVVSYVHAQQVHDGAVFVGALQAAEAAEAARRAAASRRSSSGGGGMPSGGGGGDCYSRAPAGFPRHVIDRESGGNPEARNPSGAYGCAQIMPEHFNGGACTGMSYDACWSRLWNGGAGASNWSQTL